MSHVTALGDNVPMLAAGPTAHCTLGTSTHCTVGILPPHMTVAWLLVASPGSPSPCLTNSPAVTKTFSLILILEDEVFDSSAHNPIVRCHL